MVDGVDAVDCRHRSIAKWEEVRVRLDQAHRRIRPLRLLGKQLAEHGWLAVEAHAAKIDPRVLSKPSQKRKEIPSGAYADGDDPDWPLKVGNGSHRPIDDTLMEGSDGIVPTADSGEVVGPHLPDSIRGRVLSRHGVPAPPGCGAQAETLEGPCAMAREAILGHSFAVDALVSQASPRTHFQILALQMKRDPRTIRQLSRYRLELFKGGLKILHNLLRQNPRFWKNLPHELDQFVIVMGILRLVEEFGHSSGL